MGLKGVGQVRERVPLSCFLGWGSGLGLFLGAGVDVVDARCHERLEAM